jgi:transcriptional regulator with XRE-family HTH domain
MTGTEKRKRTQLRALVAERYPTQGHFADAVGMWPQEVSDVLNGKRPITERIVEKWVQVLQIPQNRIGFYFFPDLR